MKATGAVALLALLGITLGTGPCDNLPPTPTNADAWTITNTVDDGQASCAAALTTSSILTYKGNPPTPDQPPGSDWLAKGKSPGALFIPANNYTCRFFDVTAVRNHKVFPTYTWLKGNLVTLAVTYPHLAGAASKKAESLMYVVSLPADGQDTVLFKRVIVISGSFPEIASVTGAVNFGLWPAQAGATQLQRAGYTAAKMCSITNYQFTCP